MKKKLFGSLVVSMSVFLLFSAGIYASETENIENNELNAVPIATFSGPTTVNGGESNSWTVGTTYSYGPHTFYFNPGDGTGQKRLDGIGNGTSRVFSHTYRGTSNVKSYTASARTADQLNISDYVYKSITVRAW
ncbi:hypothetical protein [Piscibacillus halophilus]|uniref:hypothetical protein n=1 Tax=Piscibacillus halophilus TaxID=571933 RepID=UPI002409204E|nr:hypothetical protein [Piscibacillus halophilus]